MKNVFLVLIGTFFLINCHSGSGNQPDTSTILSVLFPDHQNIDKDKATIQNFSFKGFPELNNKTIQVETLGINEVGEKLFVLTASKEEGAGCYGCAPLISLAGFMKAKKGLRLIWYNHYVKAGAYGEASPTDFLFDEDQSIPFLVVRPGGTNQGITTENIDIYSFDLKKGKASLALSVQNTYEDNVGACEEEEGSCYRFETMVSLDNSTLILVKSGTVFDWNEGKVVNVHEEKKYSLVKNKFQEKREL